MYESRQDCLRFFDNRVLFLLKVVLKNVQGILALIDLSAIYRRFLLSALVECVRILTVI